MPSGGDDFIWLCVPQCFSIKLYCRAGFSFMAITWKFHYCSSNVAFIIYTQSEEWCLKIHIYVCFYTHTYLYSHSCFLCQQILYHVREELICLYCTTHKLKYHCIISETWRSWKEEPAPARELGTRTEIFKAATGTAAGSSRDGTNTNGQHWINYFFRSFWFRAR